VVDRDTQILLLVAHFLAGLNFHSSTFKIESPSAIQTFKSLSRERSNDDASRTMRMKERLLVLEEIIIIIEVPLCHWYCMD
jgi:hypothetical protein